MGNFNSIQNRSLSKIEDKQPEYDLSIKTLCEKYGYVFEEFEIETEDHYLLSLHRIRYPKTTYLIRKKLPVLVVHGLGSCSIHWLINGNEKSLGFRLATEGYDVWMPNLRGNIFSRKHRYLSSYNWLNSFWDFSFHETGVFDLPVIVDFILKTTRESKLYYIGMSQGTTSFLTLTSIRPEYNDKIKAFVALAPVAYMANPKALWIKAIKKSESFLKFIWANLYIKEFAVPSLLRNMLKLASKDGSLLQASSFKLFQFFTLTDERLFNKSKLAILLANFSSFPIKTLLHYTQISKTGVFKAFDYGTEGNKLHYGHYKPPQYNLSLVTTASFLIYAANDFLTNTDDVKRLIKELPNVVQEKLVDDEFFGHSDFCCSENVNSLVYEDIIKFLADFT